MCILFQLGRRIEGVTCIIDLENVGTSMLWGPGMQMIAQMGKVVQDNYPESVKRSFIVNGKRTNQYLDTLRDCKGINWCPKFSAPGIFPMLWRMIRPLVTEDMKRKVCILGCKWTKYRTEALYVAQTTSHGPFPG